MNTRRKFCILTTLAVAGSVLGVTSDTKIIKVSKDMPFVLIYEKTKLDEVSPHWGLPTKSDIPDITIKLERVSGLQVGDTFKPFENASKHGVCNNLYVCLAKRSDDIFEVEEVEYIEALYNLQKK